MISLWRFGILVSSLVLIPGIHASTPNTIVTIEGLEGQKWMTKRGLFGSEDAVTGLLVHTPVYDEFLCQYYNERNYTVEPISPPQGEKWVMLVPRGLCAFERKAFAAKMWYGVSGILVYDTLSARYRWSDETNEMVRWPQDEADYDCSMGFGTVSNIQLDPPQYSQQLLDPILDMKSPTTNCTLEQTREPCESQLCLVTGRSAGNSSEYPVCCAWDLPLTMSADKGGPPGDVDDVVAVFLTIRQGQDLLPFIGRTVTLAPRPHRAFNASQIFLWMMGVLVTFLASYFSATDLRIFRAKLAQYEEAKGRKEPGLPIGDEEQPREHQAPEHETDNPTGRSPSADEILGMDDLQRDDDAAPLATDDEEVPPGKTIKEDKPKPKRGDASRKSRPKKGKEAWSLHSLPPKGKENDRGKVFTLYSLPPPSRKPKEKNQRQRPGYKAEVTMETDVLPSDGGGRHVPQPWASPVGGFEMTQWHVLGFVVLASLMLFMLFYFRFYPVVFVLYGIGCAGGVSHLIFGPILVRVGPMLGGDVVKELNKNVVCGLNGFDVTSQLLGFIWAIVWIWYGMSHYRPSTNPFFWITIDIFGACFCVLALSMMKLGNIKIATLLLIAVFTYDIFFVFITPLFLDGQSIMITVAKGGGGETVADDFCYKYPEDKDCTGIDFLPMLLLVPRFNDYQRGSALLGLGDIVLPGYLIAFCARLDEAKRIVGKHTNKEMEYTEKWYQGYFFWLMVAYGIGLVLAFVAFGISGTGQPALLYLVPCCLGTICIIGRKELKDLWTGSLAIKLALKLQNQFERAWGKEQMRRDVAKAKRSRGEETDHHPFRTSETPESGRGSRDDVREGPGRGRGRGHGRGRGRGGRGGRGRNDNGQPSITPTGDASKITSINSTGDASTSTKPKGFVHPRSPHSDGRHRKGSSSKSNDLPEKSILPVDDNNDARGPTKNDVCFGDPKNIGVKHLRTVIKRELKPDPKLEFGPSILESILKRLGGRRFYVSDGGNGWIKATEGQTADEISKVFLAEKGKS